MKRVNWTSPHLITTLPSVKRGANNENMGDWYLYYPTKLRGINMAVSNKGKRILIIMERWVKGEISSEQADRELKLNGVKLPIKEG